MQAQTTTIIAPQEHAPWYSRYQVPWPEATVGNWRIERFQVSEADEKFGRMRALFSSSSRGRYVPAGTYTRLVTGEPGASLWNGPMMSDTPDEIADHLEAIRRAGRSGGDCLVNGLGLGMVARAMLEEGAASVTAVEIDADIIALVAPHLQAAYGEQFRVVHADSLAWRPATGQRWSVVWHDIWPTICPDHLPEMHHLHRKYGRRCDWQGSWSRSIIESRRTP